MAAQELHEKDSNQVVVDKAKDFWSKYNKPIMIVSAIVILVAGGYIGYKKFYKEPQETKAADAMYKAEYYFKSAQMSESADSLLKLALNGDGINAGFLKVISKYSGTEAANLAKYYAGASYALLNDNANVIKYLKDFSTDSKVHQAKAYKLLADAYGDTGKNQDALEYYKKAAHEFPDDKENSSEALFMAAYFAETILKNNKEAIELYKELKKDYSQTRRGFDADKYLARLGVYNAD